MSDLLVRPSPPAKDGTILTISPESARWEYVGFEVLQLRNGMAAMRETAGRELCVVVLTGTVAVRRDDLTVEDLGGRRDLWSEPPDAAYLPPGGPVSISGDGEVALCWAPAPGGGAAARRLPAGEIVSEVRGFGGQTRTVRSILLADRPAESLLVSETLTPEGNWSSYPPHQHEADDPPRQARLEETYYHRLTPAQGFALQRVYTDDRALDDTVAVGDRDCVLVPRGYHTVATPPGYDLYYLNVMAGPRREWAVANDPDHDWRLSPPASETSEERRPR